MPAFTMTDRTSRHIRSVVVKRTIDDCPDTSWIGEYHSDYREGAIDRKERGDMGRSEFRYFSPAITGEESGNPDSPEQDYQRMEAFNGGDWHFIGVTAEADIVLHGGIIQRIHSGGLWGIESDSNRSYIESVESDELSDLREQLHAVGFTDSEIDPAFENAKRIDN